MTNLIGQSLGRYHILEQLGEGGMATVYKAYDTRLETDVAVKVIRTENLAPSIVERALKRFEREAKALAKLTHANIVKVIDYGEYKTKPYLVMPFLPGGTLKQRLQGKPMPWQDAVHLLLPIARALSYAHKQGMIHRDIKPSNILITDAGDPLLTDFGIAKIIDEETTVDLTGTNATVGTPEYMAPEQVTSKSVDARADIYALGVVFFEMVTGRKPFQADTPMAVLFKQASEPLPRPKQFVHDLPDDVEKVLIKALAKKPEDRFQSMEEFLNVMEQLGQRTQAATATMQPNRPTTPIISPSYGPLPGIQPSSRSGFSPKGWTWGVIGVGSVLGLTCLIGTVGFIFKLIPGGIVYPVSASTQTPRLTVIQTLPVPTATPVSLPIPTDTTVPSLMPIDTAVPSPVPLVSEKDGMLMVYVSEGEFQMGSNEVGDEVPEHMVYLNAYWIDQTEVTNAMYRLCRNTGVCSPPMCDVTSNNRPVACISWYDAQAYCEWAGRRLPTEAEWEKAARGTDGRKYPWGNQPPSGNLLNLCDKNCLYGDSTIDDGFPWIAPVGSYPQGASPYGALDMAGNVWEWVSDWYNAGYYSVSPTQNPQGPSSGEYRVMRGGSWHTPDTYVSSTTRGYLNPGFTNIDLIFFDGPGFRCARSLP